MQTLKDRIIKNGWIPFDMLYSIVTNVIIIVFTGAMIGIISNMLDSLVIGVITGIVIGILIMILTERPIRRLYYKLDGWVKTNKKTPRYEYSLPFPTEIFNQVFGNLDDEFQNRIRELIDSEWGQVMTKVQTIIDQEPEADKLKRASAVDAAWEWVRDNIVNP